MAWWSCRPHFAHGPTWVYTCSRWRNRCTSGAKTPPVALLSLNRLQACGVRLRSSYIRSGSRSRWNWHPHSVMRDSLWAGYGRHRDCGGDHPYEWEVDRHPDGAHNHLGSRKETPHCANGDRVSGAPRISKVCREFPRVDEHIPLINCHCCPGTWPWRWTGRLHVQLTPCQLQGSGVQALARPSNHHKEGSSPCQP